MYRVLFDQLTSAIWSDEYSCLPDGKLGLAGICDVRPALPQHWVDISCMLGIQVDLSTEMTVIVFIKQGVPYTESLVTLTYQSINQHAHIPFTYLVNTDHWHNFGSMLCQRIRRVTDIEPALGQCFVSNGQRHTQANTTPWNNVVLLLGRRLQRRPNIKKHWVNVLCLMGQARVGRCDISYFISGLGAENIISITCYNMYISYNSFSW